MVTERFALPVEPVPAARLCLEQRMPAGDPAQLRFAARRAGHTAEELRRTSAALLSTVDSALWTGAAHRAFAEQVRAHAPLLSATVERYERYADLLGTYAAALDETAPRLAAARSRLYQRYEELAGQGFASELTSAADPGFSAGNGRQSAAAELLPLAQSFKACYDRWADALDRCLLALRQTDQADPTHDRHGLRALGHQVGHLTVTVAGTFEQAVLHPSLSNISACLSELNTGLSVLGVGLLFIYPPAGAACLAVATVLAVAQLAVDSTRRAHGEHVSNTSLGFDLAATIPIGGGAMRSLRAADNVVHLVPGGGLLAHEGLDGGHTLAKHVGKSEEFLRNRLATEPGLSAASTFHDREAAERAISEALARNRARIEEWLGTPSRGIRVTARVTVRGSTLGRDNDELAEVSRVMVVLRRDSGFTSGYRIHTAWPAP